MEKIKNYLLIGYILGLVFLGIRPEIKFSNNSSLNYSEMGRWSMYQKYVKSIGEITMNYKDKVTKIDWQKYIPHGSFSNSTHPNVSEKAMQSFLSFIENNDPIVQKTKLNRLSPTEKIELKFELLKIVEERDSVIYVFKKIL